MERVGGQQILPNGLLVDDVGAQNPVRPVLRPLKGILGLPEPGIDEVGQVIVHPDRRKALNLSGGSGTLCAPVPPRAPD